MKQADAYHILFSFIERFIRLFSLLLLYHLELYPSWTISSSYYIHLKLYHHHTISILNYIIIIYYRNELQIIEMSYYFITLFFIYWEIYSFILSTFTILFSFIERFIRLFTLLLLYHLELYHLELYHHHTIYHRHTISILNYIIILYHHIL